MCRIDEVRAEGLEAAESALFVGADQPRIADHVSG
jgi:hypothetical protein